MREQAPAAVTAPAASPAEPSSPAASESSRGAVDCVDGYWCHASGRCTTRWSECGGVWGSLAAADGQLAVADAWTAPLASLAAAFVASSLAGIWLRRHLGGATAHPTPLKGAED
eukprot:scaffold29659_cov112-Isochrysis_galbana.AAC.2